MFMLLQSYQEILTVDQVVHLTESPFSEGFCQPDKQESECELEFGKIKQIYRITHNPTAPAPRLLNSHIKEAVKK